MTSMDEEQLGTGSETEDENPKPKKKHVFRRGLTAVVTLMLVAAAVLVFAYRDHLNSDGLRELFGRTLQTEDMAAPFSYENGSDQTFARVGDGLAVASASGVQLLDESGAVVFSQVTSMDVPAVTASSVLALFYDVGGSTCKAVGIDGVCTDVDAGSSIISASVNPSGYFTVISEESGSKGLVRVFDAECALLYEWYSGTGYALKAQVCPDNKSLAVLCITSEGSVIHIFKLSSEDEQASISYEGELLFDMYFMSNDRICAISEGGMFFAGMDGSQIGAYSFEGKYLGAYDFGSTSFAAVYISEYRTGDGGLLVTLDQDGNVLGTAETDGDVTSISANGRQLLTTSSGSICLYSQALQLQKSEEVLVTAKRALLRSKGDVLLLSSYFAETFDF